MAAKHHLPSVFFPRTTGRKPRFVIIACALGASLALGGCTAHSLPSPHEYPQSRPALSDTQIKELHQKIAQTVKDNDAKHDAGALPREFDGPFADIRRGEYSLLSVGALESTRGLGEKILSYTVSTAESFPRLAALVTSPPEGKNTNMLVIYSKMTPRENWGIWASMPIVDNAKFPTFAAGAKGISLLAEDSNEAMASPSKAFDTYIASANGQETDVKIQDDSLRASMNKTREQNAAAVEGAGEASVNFARNSHPLLSLPTADGGLLTIGEIDITSHIAITADRAKVTLGTAIGALASGQAGGKIEVTKNMDAHYAVSVALYVPPAKDTSGSIRLVAATSPVLESVNYE